MGDEMEQRVEPIVDGVIEERPGLDRRPHHHGPDTFPVRRQYSTRSSAQTRGLGGRRGASQPTSPRSYRVDSRSRTGSGMALGLCQTMAFAQDPAVLLEGERDPPRHADQILALQHMRG